MRRLIFATIAGLLCLAVAAFAQSSRQLIITVVDPTDQAVPGVTVTIEQRGKTPQTLTTDGSGQAVTAVVADGTYRVTATLEGFTDAPPVSVRVAGNQPTRTTLRLGLPRVSDSVTVAGGADTPAADTAVQTDSITPDGSADDQILQNTIDALAGIGSVVRVDGLSSGGLPPAATIQQIRIRQNSFDAEYHEATPAFVEIITNAKPQPWQVSFTTWNRPESAQARNAFAVGEPASQRGGANFNGTGNINNRASVNFFGNINSGKEDQPLYAQTPAGAGARARRQLESLPLRHAPHRPRQLAPQRPAVRKRLPELPHAQRRRRRLQSRRARLHARSDDRARAKLLDEAAAQGRQSGAARPVSTPVRKQHTRQHGARHRRAQRVLVGRRAVSGHARRQSDRSVGRRDAAGRHEAGLPRRPALLARRLRQLHHQQRGRHLHVLVARRVHRRTADDLHAPARCAGVLLQRLADGVVGAGRHRGVEDRRDLGRTAAGIRERHVTSAQSRAARAARLVARPRAAHDIPSGRAACSMAG